MAVTRRQERVTPVRPRGERPPRQSSSRHGRLPACADRDDEPDDEAGDQTEAGDEAGDDADGDADGDIDGEADGSCRSGSAELS
ncbi:hypothetical protein HCC61_25535 [Streptomyces sp. HNM0575]|uniref:hypothetical protein n=1 Tax=Streptomyces sp. HNM0575 TaxID=2716338 RepID=UPI00145E3253|nr:hypothetical protein [Streptomyces sp. HNM0575]NLU75972.1 hypothetical protein [Streptomyces sp. HNM0575]